MGGEVHAKLKKVAPYGVIRTIDGETVEYYSEQESYACIWEDDILDIPRVISEIAPTVKAHVSAVITITYTEGYDLCVDADCADGNVKAVIFEDHEGYYDDDDDEED